MIKRIKLERFKNFESAELILGPLTLLIGSNASGKSNICDALRFLKGIPYGYSLAEIMGEKYEGGLRQWPGIRGGTRKIAYQQSDTFVLTVNLEVREDISSTNMLPARYSIEVEPGPVTSVPRIVREALYRAEEMIFKARLVEDQNKDYLEVSIPADKDYQGPSLPPFPAGQPILSQIVGHLFRSRADSTANTVRHFAEETLKTFLGMRFFELEPEAMRRPSFPGQTTLGDRGENLSSVLQAIWDDAQQKEMFIDWVRELTPMDAKDFEFFVDQSGRISLTLLEGDGQKTSIHSASDGTLRFLGMIAALLGPKADQFYVFDEIDTGLHPARLYLLLQLLEWKAFKGGMQIVGATHSSQLLSLLSSASQKYTSLVYRVSGTSQAHIKQIMEIPEIQRILEDQDLGLLHGTGWFEHMIIFDEEATA